MGLIEWVNSNGVTAMLVWAGILIVAGTVPPLPADAGFWAKWAYGALKVASLNARGIQNALQGAGMNIKLPELQLSKGTGNGQQEPPPPPQGE